MAGARAGAGVTTALAERTDANALFFEREAERIARLCHRLAERFARGGRLVSLGESPQARSDVRHVAVEFVHPVIVGKRALPGLAPPNDVVRALRAGDVAVSIAHGADGPETLGFRA